MKLLRDILIWFTTICFYGSTYIVQAGESSWTAPAPPASATNSWATHASKAINWIPVERPSRNGMQRISLPRDNYTVIARGTWQHEKKAFDWSVIDGPAWITANRPEIGRIGGGEVDVNTWFDTSIRQQPGNGKMVFATYSPETMELRIMVQKVEKLPNGDVIVAVMDFTPHHGRHWQWGKAYKTAEEQNNTPDTMGHNPFAAFAGATTDPIFHNVSWSAAAVAVGHAITRHKALFGWIAISEIRYDTLQSKSGGIFRKKVTTTTKAYLKPRWIIAGPAELVPGGQHHSICVGPESQANPSAGCKYLERVAQSSVLLADWRGDGMPTAVEEQIYEWSQQKSGWTVAFFVVLTFLVVAGGGLLMAGAGGMGTTGAALSTGANISAQGALATGAAAGGAYAAVSTGLFDKSLTSVQRGYLGSVTSGVMAPAAHTGPHEARIAEGVANRMIKPEIYSGSAHSSIGQLFGVECPLALSVKECWAAGKNPGLGWRKDSYAQEKTVLRMRKNYQRCKDAGYTGETLHKCAAPGGSHLLMAIP